MMKILLVCALTLLTPAYDASADSPPEGFKIEVLVDGRALPVYLSRGTRYIEALKSKEYSIRIHNPTGVRVAVALAVDGLNTIDARRTTARDARKWVLAPHETITIGGWQTSLEQARRFFFTSEEESYARWLGQTANTGVISAVFYRERLPVNVITPAPKPTESSRRRDESGRDAAQQRAGEGRAEASAPASPAASPDEYAATGIGRQTDHRVQQVHLDLESHPVASFDLRYEYRSQLVKLGVLPSSSDKLTRRERARGFDDGFCPVPPRPR
jgi:hypothetical protein